MSRKILISTGYGAGWSSWSDDDLQAFALEYQPIIDFLEQGGEFIERPYWQRHDVSYHEPWLLFEEPGASVLKGFYNALAEEFPEKRNEDTGHVYFYLGGAKGLEVVEVNGPVRITEYDGDEWYVEQSQEKYL